MLKDHQYFEDRLLSEATLSPEEAFQLQEHLLTCDSCRRLSHAWGEVEDQLEKSPVVSPAPGFMRRWEARLVDEREEIHGRQTALILALCAGGAILSLVVVGYWLLPLIQAPLPFFLVWSYQFILSFYDASSIGAALGTVMRTIYALLPPTLWVAICIATGALCALWIFIIQKLTAPRRVTL